MVNEKRLISLDEALKATHGEIYWTESQQAAVRSFLVKQPKVDAVEVVHGRWIKYKDEKFIGYDADGRIKYRNVYSYNCNKCGHGTAVKSNFCPACGAKMEGVKEVGY